MGGKEGAWGYLAQAVVSVIYSLVEEEWDTVQVEPDTKNDKVDIAWFYKEQPPRVVQVKTSKNNFTLPDMRRWLESLIDDVKEAEEYKLILLGTCNDETKKVINRINENKATNEDFDGKLVLEENKEKLKINLKTNEQDSLDSQIYRYLSKFLSNKRKHPNNTELEIMCKAIGYQYMVLSTNGKKVTKQEFETQLITWIDSFLGISEARKSALKIEFYLKDNVPYSSEMNAVNTKLRTSKFIKNKRRDLLSLYKEITERTIEQKDRNDPNDEDEEIFKRLRISIGMSMTIYSEISGKRRKELESLAHELLEVQMNDEFFYVGNLKEPMVRPKHMFGYSPVERTGTGEEIDKFNLLLEFENELEILQSYTKMFAFLDSINLIPVVIRNNGTRRDEEIKVKIYLPKSVRIVKVSEFMIPDDRIIKDFTGFKGFIHYKFTHSSDGHINSYLHQPYDLYPLPFLGLEDGGKRNRELFPLYLGSLFDFKLHSHGESQLLVFEFDKLNPKETSAFPCFVPVWATENFEITYEITSAHLPLEERGTLLYKVKSE